ncbi:MAG: hypothetical protein ACLU4N_26375 [Butyricimonas faecihominis]
MDTEITHSFYALTDGAVDRSQENHTYPSAVVVMPINENDISASNGTIKQNNFK